uniref:NAC domain-containing protein n=1 Tax=Kalanchoe fedtschenkoi TaxID=63787 RepID=A0A7N0ULQ1_KALFE
MKMGSGRQSSELPPGFRFHPTDEELIMCYLRNQAASRPCPVSIIPEVDIYKFDPWQLPDKAEVGENEWYFFSPRDRKYPNGVRPNRATVSGYWKATGTDKAIHSGSKYVGVKKALVFYSGRPPKGVKTDWIMHEYRLTGSQFQPSARQSGTMRLDDWVLCRIYKKKPMAGRYMEPREVEEPARAQAEVPAQAQTNLASSEYTNEQKIPRTFSISNFLDMDYIGSISQLLNDNQSYNPAPETQSNGGTSTTSNSSSIMYNNHRGGAERFQQGEMMVSYPYTNQGRYQAANQHIGQQMLRSLNPVYGFQTQ